MHQAVALPSRRPVRRRRARQTLLLAVASLTLAASTPVAAPAQSSQYEACYTMVLDWYDDCRDNASSFWSEGRCLVVGVVGILGCAVLEAIRELGKGVSLA